jgi:hypothetical protein
MAGWKNPWDMGEYRPSKEQSDAYIWCVRNNIKIYPVGIPGGGAWFIEIENNNKKNRTPNMFIKTQIWEKLFEYCKYYYDKYEK